VSQHSDEPLTRPLTRPPAGPLVLVIGNLTIDDVVLPDGTTRMATLGGNTVHAATAVVTGGARAAVAARRGEDFPPGALAALAAAGIDLTGLVDIPGPTVRNWVIYEADGRRHWLYRTPPQRSAEVAPEPADLDPAMARQAAVVHVAAMPLGNAERIVAHVRRHAPAALITVDSHESWDEGVAGRVLALARMAGLFMPSLEELARLTGAGDPAGGLRALAAAGLRRAVVKAAAAGAFVLDEGRIVQVPAGPATVLDCTGAGDAFCGGFAAGLACGLGLVDAAGLGAAVAAAAITGSGSLRLLQAGLDRAAVAETGRRLAGAAAVAGQPAGTAAGSMAAPGNPPAPVAAGTPAAGSLAAPGYPASPRATTARGRPRAAAAQADRTGRDDPVNKNEATAYGGGSAAADLYDIGVMRREIAMIPGVISDVLDDAGGQATALAKRLASRGIRHLWLTGCGDSAFAGLAAELAFQRHAGLTAHPVHALDLARYRARMLPAGSAVIALSFSGKVGRTTEAAIQARRRGHHVVALTGAADGPLARASDEVLPLDVPTLGFSPGTSTYVAMLGTLLRLAAALAALRGDGAGVTEQLARLPASAEATLAASADPAVAAAEALLPAPWVAYLGAGPNEATARFGAAKLFEGSQQLGVATNIEEWAHGQYFVTSAGDPVVLVNPSGAGHDRGVEILSELRFMTARPVVISDVPLPGGGAAGELLLPLAAGVPEELSPVTACLPAALVGFHLARLRGRRSYNFPGEAARQEHYATIHRATIGEPA
jgi:fructoselysine-6-P-deglycase FrlB-like protein/sugar/nucleoside kinase (ribokinase family)